jgi:DNA-binding response OmpR family regulator
MKKILIVEDELAYLKIIHDHLVEAGYDVIDAKDGEEGFKLAFTHNPDLILLDLIMPKVGGLQMLKKLRSTIWGKDIPVFILSNINESTSISEAMNNKTSQYLVKSDLKLEDLLQKINMFLQRG